MPDCQPPEPESISLERRIRARIKIWRIRKGFSLSRLASRAGMSYSKIYRLETGSGRILVRDLFALAQTLNISIDAFYDSMQQQPRELTLVERDSEQLLESVQLVECGRTRRRISSLIRTIADTYGTPEVNNR